MISYRHDTILGDIPDDWESKPLASLLADCLSGDWGDNDGEAMISVLRSTNFTNSGDLKLDDIARRGFSKAKAEKIQIEPGDILIERSGGGLNQPVGRVAMVREPMPGTGFANFIQTIRPTSEIHAEYLFWVLHQVNKSGAVEKLQHQTTQMRNLDLRDYLKILLPCPTAESEQKAIANALYLANEQVRLLAEKLRLARRAKRALLSSLFLSGLKQSDALFESKWITCPKHWRVAELHTFASVKSGFTMGRDLGGTERVTIPYVTVINVQAGRFNLEKISSIEIKTSELETHTLKFGDILMTEGGDRDKLGRGGMWREEVSPCSYQNHVFRVRLEEEVYMPDLFHHLIQTRGAKNYFLAHAKQTSNLCTINSRELNGWRIAIPPLGEQKKMAEAFDAMDAVVEGATSAVTKARRLKQSLLQNLLTGKIRIRG